MGEVYLAWDSKLKREVAIKLMDTSIGRYPDLIARFEREADTIANLRHPNIVKIYDKDHYEIQGQTRYFIVMEYVEGEDLATLIDKKIFISFEQKLEIVIKICRALDHAHNRQVIHRDIKPSNVRITTDGDVCILDFGLAKFKDAQPVNSLGIFGTPHYMSPEQTLSSGSVDNRTDLFSAALILYELITYEKPFHVAELRDSLAYMAAIRSEPHVPISQRLPQCSEDLVQIVDRALQKKPEDRFESCGKFADALTAFAKALPQKEDALSVVAEQLRETVVQCASKCAGLQPESSRMDPVEGTEPVVNHSEVIQFRAKNVQLDYGLNLLRCRDLDARKTDLLEILHAKSPNKSSLEWAHGAPEQIKQWLDLTRRALQKPLTRRAAIVGPVVLVATGVLVYIRSAHTEPGRLELDVTPWAKVDSIINVKTAREALTQEIQTPCNIELPPGAYVVYLSNPKLGKMQTQVNISSGKSNRVHETFPGFVH